MKALIFAAGLGTRLRPLTDTIPKALVPVLGVPMLEQVILRVMAVGVTEIVVNVHYKAEQIVDFLHGKNNFGATIHISDETDCLLDTGGGLKKAAQWLQGNEPVCIHNADILTDINLKDLLDSHLNNKALATLAVMQRNSNRSLLFDDTNRLRGWRNKQTNEVKNEDLLQGNEQGKSFSGVQIVSPDIFNYMFPESVFSIIDLYLTLAVEHPIIGVDVSAAQWYDIGSLEKLAEAEKNWRLRSPAWE